MRARAHLATERTADGRTRISALRSEAPLMLRSTLAARIAGHPPWTSRLAGAAHVHLTAGAAGPIGGDHLALRVDVGAGSALVLRDVSSTLLLPGPANERSRTRIDVQVAADATFVWLPEPVIAARGCDHRTDVRVGLERGARLLLREELLLGRHGEEPGTVRQDIRVRLDGRALHHQQLAIAPQTAGWDGPAVTGGHRAIGSLLVVDPAWRGGPPPGRPLDGDAARMALTGPAVLVSAMRPDSLSLRRDLDTALAALYPAPASPRVPRPDGHRAAPADMLR
ncbi:urease accessory protein UreD [Actinomadura chokoriensis]|uniref:urease accessory protein UreD n=1 Tax=Actinomadura chokoriensis TaxID=454156 RepID=UPI0031F872D4